MRMETKIAFANMKYYKNKNILIGIAVFLTSLLLFLVPTIGQDFIDVQFTAVNKIYPTWHAVFRNVDTDTVTKLANHHSVAEYGVRSDVGYATEKDVEIALMYLDEAAVDLYHMELEEGRMPEKENEIVVSNGMLHALGIKASVGDTITLPYQVFEENGLGYRQSEEFIISGMMADSGDAEENRMFSVFVSKSFLEKRIPADEIRYRFLFQITADKEMDTDDIEQQIQQLADQFRIADTQVGINQEYLMANYVDPAFRSAIIVIMGIIVLAGIITIYSIYYVNLPERVQEFGRLKATGATRRQIKKILLLEGIGITLIALPIGLIAGTILTKVILTAVFRLLSGDNVMVSTIYELMEQGELTFFSFGLYLLAVVITLATVYVSLLKPVSVAAKISEIDAMRYERNATSVKSKKKHRKSSKNVNVLRLSLIYLFGNKKNSLITIISMSITGIFIMVVATVLSCANPRESANDDILGQYRIVIDVEEGNKEHPEKEWNQVIKKNPLTDDMKKQIEQIEGINSVSCFNAVFAKADYFADEPQGIGGIPKEYEKTLLDGIVEGEVTIEELNNSNKVIVDKNLLYWYPDVKIGDTFQFEVVDGTGKNKIEVEVAALGDYSIAFSEWNYFLTTYQKVETICPENVNASFHVFADKEYDEATCQSLLALIQDNSLLKMDAWKAYYETWKKTMATINAGCYVFLGIISVICVMNMVNTMINSVQVRKKEIGIMQAIGMSDRQLVRMLQQEGLFYTVGTLVVSVGMGSLISYPIYQWAKWEGLFNIRQYHYPWKAVFVISIALVLLQTVLSAALGKSVKKQSVIERIRFSE